MKKGSVSIGLLAAMALVFVGGVNQAVAFGEGSWSDCLTGGRAVTVAPYGKIGYQSMTVNLNVPIGGIDPTGVGWFTWNDMDAKMNRQDLLVGSLGVRTLVGEKLGLFAEATVSAVNSGNVTTNFTNNPVGQVPTNPTGWSWPTNRVQWWDLNFGGSLNLKGSGTLLLLGIKFDKLTQVLDTPNLFVAPANTYTNASGDLQITTCSPYFGFGLDGDYWRFDLIWSPFLTSYRADMPLGLAFLQVGAGGVAGAKYQFTGAGGNLLEAYGEAKFNLFYHLAAKLWLKGSWLNCKGNGNRDFADYQYGFAPPNYGSGSDSAQGSLTRYLWALGVLGEIKF